MGLDQRLKLEILIERDEAYWIDEQWLDELVVKVCTNLDIPNEWEKSGKTGRRYRLTAGAISQICTEIQNSHDGKIDDSNRFYRLVRYAQGWMADIRAIVAYEAEAKEEGGEEWVLTSI